MSNYRTKFLTKSTTIHGDRYDYSNIPEEFTFSARVTITCRDHGPFTQKARTHCIGSGCPVCAIASREQKIYSTKRHTLSQFVDKARLVHGDYYDYSTTTYAGQMKQLTVTCPKHGPFDIVANNHIFGTGCAKCKRSRGETIIEQWLIANHIQYVAQKTFPDLALPDCVKKTNRPKYDFFIPSINTLIEFDGKQHTQPVRFRGVSDEEAVRLHKRTMLSDKVKDEYANVNNIALVRIPYTDIDNIPAILDATVKSVCRHV